MFPTRPLLAATVLATLLAACGQAHNRPPKP